MKNPSAEIYLDMDGVCVDFIGAAMEAQGYDPAPTLAAWHRDHPGSLYPESLMGKPAMEFFTHEYLHTSEFWASLVPYEWFEHLYSELNRLGHVVFLTAPTGAPGCVAGKHEWLINRFGHDFNDFIFTRHKARLAHPHAYLIDDMPFNTKPFSERNGHGILFPQIWNEHANIKNPVDHVIELLETKIQSAP
ncbi:MAG: 5'(3')-deoxyribonucleotidase [Candidatus Azotimanducaceae bacterium]